MLFCSCPSLDLEQLVFRLVVTSDMECIEYNSHFWTGPLYKDFQRSAKNFHASIKAWKLSSFDEKKKAGLESKNM